MLYLPCVLDHFHLHSKAAEFEIEAGFLKHFHISQSSGDPSVYVIDSMVHVLWLITGLICICVGIKPITTPLPAAV